MSKVIKPTTNISANKTATSTVASTTKALKVIEFPPLFTKDNYLWMGIGGVIIALGLILMSGGKNQDPNVFDTNVVYSFTRITIAPILIVGGLVVEIFAIFKKQKTAA